MNVVELQEIASFFSPVIVGTVVFLAWCHLEAKEYVPSRRNGLFVREGHCPRCGAKTFRSAPAPTAPTAPQTGSQAR